MYSHAQIRTGIRVCLNEEELEFLDCLDPNDRIENLFKALIKAFEPQTAYVREQETKLNNFSRRPNNDFLQSFYKLKMLLSKLQPIVPRLQQYGSKTSILSLACSRLINESCAAELKVKLDAMKKVGRAPTVDQMAEMIDDLEIHEKNRPSVVLYLYPEQSTISTVKPATLKQQTGREDLNFERSDSNIHVENTDVQDQLDFIPTEKQQNDRSQNNANGKCPQTYHSSV